MDNELIHRFVFIKKENLIVKFIDMRADLLINITDPHKMAGWSHRSSQSLFHQATNRILCQTDVKGPGKGTNSSRVMIISGKTA